MLSFNLRQDYILLLYRFVMSIKPPLHAVKNITKDYQKSWSHKHRDNYYPGDLEHQHKFALSCMLQTKSTLSLNMTWLRVLTLEVTV